jgi:hypothetical protein
LNGKEISLIIFIMFILRNLGTMILEICLTKTLEKNWLSRRQRFSRLERFSKPEKIFLFSKRGVINFYSAGVFVHDRRIGP